MMALYGNYSFENHVVSTHYPDSAEEVVSALTFHKALTRKIDPERVTYAKGCEIMGEDTAGFPAAVSLAESATVAVIVVGDPKVIGPGEMVVAVGCSSQNIRLKDSFRLIGARRYPGEDRAMSSGVEVSVK